MKYLRFLALLLLFSACNKDEEITKDTHPVPVIELDSETGIYTIKVGRELTISPTYQYAEDALFAWTIDGKLISSGPVFKYTWEEQGDVFIKIRVDNENGFVEEELKAEVLDLTPPVVSLAIPSAGLKVVRNTDYMFTPDIQHDDLEGFSIEWTINGKVVSTEKTYTFNETETGIYPLTIRATNIDGFTVRELDIEVVETMPYAVTFPTPSYVQTSTDRFTFAGRPIHLKARPEYFDYPQYEWSVNSVVVAGETKRTFIFTPAEAGEYEVSLTVTEGTATDEVINRNITRSKSSITAFVKVTCVAESEDSRYRAADASSSPLWNKVYEYTPAPGQFINEIGRSGFQGNETTPELAVDYATKRLEEKAHVSLGSFGGYIIVGFDHSIRNANDGYDFHIQGNAFDGSSEPGIIWVMQDVNGNGLPDDEWFELKGSETGKPETTQELEVTYYRPSGTSMDVQWTASDNTYGWVDHLIYHLQGSYYPLWVKDDSYTLTGTRLGPRNTQDPGTGIWRNVHYDWGYVDNFGNDQIEGGNTTDGSGQRNGFKISNAIYSDGTAANLKYIDFIKVQCGILAKSGWLGEISTEVFSFQDISMSK